MGSYTLARKSSLSALSPLPQVFFALAGGVALFFCLLAAVLIGYDALHAGQIYPGVSVAGVDVSGLKPGEAQALLGQRLTYPQDGRVVFQDGKQVWIARPIELGLFLDVETSASAAYNLGRHGGPFTRLKEQFTAWYSGQDLPPLLVYDERMTRHYLEGIAAQVNKPTVEASLSVSGLDVVVHLGQVGRTLYIQSSMGPVEDQLRSLSDGIVPLVISETPPAILDVSQQAEVARTILSAPLTLLLPEPQEGDPGPWTFEPQKLASMLTINRIEAPDGAHYQVGMDTTQLRNFLEDLAPRLRRNPDNARFVFNDDTRQIEVIQHAVIGRALDVDATIQAVNEKLVQGEHKIPLSVIVTPPAVGDDATAQQLGITDLVSNQTSYFYGSSASRIQNIQTAASRFHGLLVPPGGTFSMADALGDVSLDNGYSEALIIYGNRTIKGVGGGVCQVSTTLFRTVFFGGYPVVERYSHAYRVYYYELTRAGNVDTDLAGLDATVFVPVVDFKFTNDTPNWLLMETYVNPSARSLNWKFYSTSDGRTVNWDTTGLQNTVEPPDPLYQENPDLAKGEIEQVDWAVDGADVTISRTVLKAGAVYFDDQFSTHYLPWRSVFEYGPGTKLPKDADTGGN